MLNRTFRPYLATMQRILIPVIKFALWQSFSLFHPRKDGGNYLFARTDTLLTPSRTVSPHKTCIANAQHNSTPEWRSYLWLPNRDQMPYFAWQRVGRGAIRRRWNGDPRCGCQIRTERPILHAKKDQPCPTSAMPEQQNNQQANIAPVKSPSHKTLELHLLQ
jgi:hypothetical protein